MYADLEEARTRRTQDAARTPDLDVQKSSRRSIRDGDDAYRSRERELADQLRKRAQASRHSNGDSDRGRRPSPSASRTPESRSPSSPRRARSRSLSRSRSRSRSPDSVRSRKSHHSRKSSIRADEEAEERRKRRREHDDDYEGARSRRRDRDSAEYDEEERLRERRRRRSDRRDNDRSLEDSNGHSSPVHRVDRDRHSSYYDDRSRDRDRYDRSYDRGHRRRGSRYDDDRRVPRRQGRYDSPALSVRSRRTPSPEVDDYEERSVFCTQLSLRLGQRDLGEFFEEYLGEGSVKDVRIVMDKLTRRSKGVGYVEFAARELVPKAIDLTGKVLFGIPIVVQMTEAARNRAQQNGGEIHRPNLPPHPAVPVAPIDPCILANIPLPMQFHTAGAPIHLNVAAPTRQSRPGPGMPNQEARLYVGSLHFSLTDENVKAVFEPFGEIEYVDLHREPETGKSKGFCFIQFKHAEDAKKALEQMNGFELAGRAIRVGNVNAKGSGGGGGGGGSGGQTMSPNGGSNQGGGNLPQLTSAFDDGGGAGLNPERRAALMEKLARNEAPAVADPPKEQERPANIPQPVTTSLLLKNMFKPEEETEPDWDKDLADDVKEECQDKYGPVSLIHVEKDSAGEIYITFANTEASKKAMEGLNGRFFGGNPISAHYVPGAFVKAKLG